MIIGAANRKPAVDENQLIHYERSLRSPLWEAYAEGFEAMFKHPDEVMEGEGQAERLYSPRMNAINWDWYEPSRARPGIPPEKHYVERKLCNALFGEKPRRLVYFHGHTGVGKTTLLRYFFRHYVPTHAPWERQRLEGLVPVLIPLSFFELISKGVEIDKKVA